MTGVDFLLAAAIALVFVGNVASHYLRIPADIGERTSQPAEDPGLAKARIGFARMTRA